MTVPSDREPGAVVAGIRLSHPNRVIYSDLGVTKQDLARYYESIADWIVPHVARRPLTLVRCREGVGTGCLYIRHQKAWGARVIRRVRIREKTKVGEYLVADDLEAIVALVQMGVVELHTWNATIDDIERPNRLVWDLDPGPDVSWTDTVEAAWAVRAAAKTLGLDCWLKTTGGRGLHVVAPLVRTRGWAEGLAFSRSVAVALARHRPDRYTTKFAKRGREQKILIDYLRNNRTNTSIAAFSTRARAGAPVSMPIAWDELGPGLDPRAFTLATVPRLLRRRRQDPWADYWRSRQRLSSTKLRAAETL
jgi:bifunctional non-homologous end joining protein LigD